MCEISLDFDQCRNMLGDSVLFGASLFINVVCHVVALSECNAYITHHYNWTMDKLWRWYKFIQNHLFCICVYCLTVTLCILYSWCLRDTGRIRTIIRDTLSQFYDMLNLTLAFPFGLNYPSSGLVILTFQSKKRKQYEPENFGNL